MEDNLIENLSPLTLKIGDLLLNPNNPRLMDKSRKYELADDRITEEKIQTSIVKEIRTEGITDLYEKIKRLGFLTIDRIVVRKLNNSNQYLVLEGNRRVTTAKVILKEHEDGILTLSERILNSLKDIEVLVYSGDNKNIIWLLQGMRHINGIKEWGALQQARFLFEMQKDKSLSATELDKMTALGRNSIASKIRSYKAFVFAKEIHRADLTETNFSLFSEAIFKKPLIQEWLGWNDSEGNFVNTENLELLLNWYIGDEDGNKRFERVLDIRDLFNSLLLPENKNILVKFLSSEEFSINEAIQEVRNKDAEKTAQHHQLDLDERFETLQALYTSLTTLPLVNILNDQTQKDKYQDIISKIKESSEFQLNLFNK